MKLKMLPWCAFLVLPSTVQTFLLSPEPLIRLWGHQIVECNQYFREPGEDLCGCYLNKQTHLLFRTEIEVNKYN